MLFKKWDDGVLNEYLKSTLNELMPIYIKLFSIIFDSGKIPENWNSGIIIANSNQCI
jgi:hypothetical protein